MLGDLPVTLRTSGVSSHDSGISLTMTCRDLCESVWRWSALSLWNNQGITLYMCLGLHSLYERFAPKVDLQTQTLPNAMSNAIEHKALITTTGFYSVLSKLTQQPIHRQPLRRHNHSDHRPVTAPGPLLRRLDHSRPNRVQNNIPTQFQRVGVYHPCYALR